MITHDDVRRIALEFPDVEERASYGGRPSWRTPKQMFAWIREQPEALVVWVESEEDKLAIVAAEPDKFFTTDHYREASDRARAPRGRRDRRGDRTDHRVVAAAGAQAAVTAWDESHT